jgi:hypothetical protein
MLPLLYLVLFIIVLFLLRLGCVNQCSGNRNTPCEYRRSDQYFLVLVAGGCHCGFIFASDSCNGCIAYHIRLNARACYRGGNNSQWKSHWKGYLRCPLRYGIWGMHSVQGWYSGEGLLRDLRAASNETIPAMDRRPTRPDRDISHG